VNTFALFVGHPDATQGGSIIHRGQGAGVAMVDNVITIVDQFRTVTGNGQVGSHIFISLLIGKCQKCLG